MFLIWRGWGLLLVVYVIAGTIGLGIIAEAILGSDAYIDSPLFPGLGLLVAGVVSVVTGRRLNGAPVPYLARDIPKDGEVFRPPPVLLRPAQLLRHPARGVGRLPDRNRGV